MKIGDEIKREAVEGFVEYIKEHYLNRDNEFMSEFEQSAIDCLGHNYSLELAQQSLDGDGGDKK
jgi:hypothetical protein